MRQFPLEQIVIATIADERRAFVARHLLETQPLTTPKLRERLRNKFQEVADALSPWPRLPQSIGDICARSLKSLYIADSVRAPVTTGKNRIAEGNAWYLTQRGDALQDFIDFSFAMSEQFGVSMFQIFGYFSGGTLTSTWQRASIFQELAERTKKGTPMRLADMQLYNDKNGNVIDNHLAQLEAAGIVERLNTSELGDGQKKLYYWFSVEKPDDALAVQLIGRKKAKFAGLMEKLYKSTSRDGKCALHHTEIAGLAGYTPGCVTKALKRLEDAEMVKTVTRHSNVEVALTPLGMEIARAFLLPLIAAASGHSNGYDAGQARSEIGLTAARFERTGLLNSVMQRYASIPKPGYENR